MTFKELIEDLQEELIDNPEYENKNIIFFDINGIEMNILSIYEHNKHVIIDIGTELDVKLRNKDLK